MEQVDHDPSNAPVIGLQIQPFNWRLRRAREARGWSRAALSRASGVDATSVGQAEKLQPISANARWKLALTLGVPEDHLFPGVLDTLPPPAPGALEIPLTTVDVVQFAQNDTQPSLEEAGVAAARQVDFAKVLALLPERHRQVIELRYGFADGEPKSLEEVAEIIGGVTRERVRQIEARALRLLRHPRHTKSLQHWMDWAVPDGSSPRPSPRPSPVTPEDASAPPPECDRYPENCRRLHPLKSDSTARPLGWCGVCWEQHLHPPLGELYRYDPSADASLTREE